MPAIEAAEELQGFPAGWTPPATELPRGDRARWKLVGNAVSPPVVAWLARSLRAPGPVSLALRSAPLTGLSRRPKAAWGGKGFRFAVEASEWPLAVSGEGLAAVLGNRWSPLSARVAAGFHRRLFMSRLRVPNAFRTDLAAYVERAHASPGTEEATLRQYARTR